MTHPGELFPARESTTPKCLFTIHHLGDGPLYPTRLIFKNNMKDLSDRR